ncbi:protein lifeguard 1 [Labrus mixtus]|uniref:protein lifeguard 1 n=1 Tax=Labrus mixtus TaxID=508554 RepID=UPI0029C0BFE0|nr:protein lifeguard 1 [Labrus mixtus]XP_060901319.1 protein lifeguard 1 [Labrus mixtus]
MSDTSDSLTPMEKQEAVGYDVSSQPPPPSYSYPEQQPPPYSADPSVFPPSKEETACISQPTSECPSVSDMNPEAPPDSTPPEKSSPFDDKTVRRGFVRKVFCIVTLMLLFTFSVVCVFTFSSVIRQAVKRNLWIYLSSFFIFLTVVIVLFCCKNFSRRHPWNIVGLVVITVSFSYMVGTVAAFHQTSAVVVTMASTIAISLAILAFSVQTRFEFNICYGILLVLAVDMIVFFIFLTFYISHVLDVTYGCLGALVFALFLMIDVQLLMGKTSEGVDPEEYVSAALIIYLDIVLIFLYLLGRK